MKPTNRSCSTRHLFFTSCSCSSDDYQQYTVTTYQTIWASLTFPDYLDSLIYYSNAIVTRCTDTRGVSIDVFKYPDSCFSTPTDTDNIQISYSYKSTFLTKTDMCYSWYNWRKLTIVFPDSSSSFHFPYLLWHSLTFPGFPAEWSPWQQQWISDL